MKLLYSKAQSQNHRFALWRLLPAALFMMLISLRLPGLLQHGRFWAEDGTLYFRNAWGLPWWRALIRPEVGYLNLSASSAAVIARYAVPLEEAPDINILISFLIQCIPAVLLVCARDAWLRRPIIFTAAILILAMPTGCDEVWLNTANSQFHLALASALCLAIDVPGRVGSIGIGLLLFLSPLSSPACVALVPLFVLRALFDRQSGRFVQAACIATGAFLQLTLFYSPWPGRGHMLGPAMLAAILTVKHLTLPLLGEQEAIIVSKSIHDDIVASHYPIRAMLAVAAALSSLLTAVLLRRRPEPFWLLAAGASIACLSYFGGLAGGLDLMTATGSNRYAFAPGMLFALCVLSLISETMDRITLAASGFIVWLIAIAAQQTILPQDRGYAVGPSWKAEITHWRKDPAAPIAIWPTGWSMHLVPRAD